MEEIDSQAANRFYFLLLCAAMLLWVYLHLSRKTCNEPELRCANTHKKARTATPTVERRLLAIHFNFLLIERNLLGKSGE
jgi:hypothetical protein